VPCCQRNGSPRPFISIFYTCSRFFFFHSSKSSVIIASTNIKFLDNIYRPEIGTSSINWTQLEYVLPENGDRIQTPKLCVLKHDDIQIKTRRWIMSKNVTCVLMYHRHKAFNHILTRLIDPVPDPLLLRKSGSTGNRTRDFWICKQEL
jgi:hypothetical protein